MNSRAMRDNIYFQPEMNDKYIQYKHILSGCSTIQDARYFADVMGKKHPEMKNIYHSMASGKKYYNALDIETVCNILNTLEKCSNVDEAREVIRNIKKTHYTYNYDSLFERVLKSLPINSDIQPAKVIKLAKIGKSCPHCDIEYHLPPETGYVICGYTGNGYDMKGCSKDWCYKCGKMLCKAWHEHMLYDERNQIHNKECCEQHAIKTKNSWPDDYCRCRQNI
jgi:hypothetical protein